MNARGSALPHSLAPRLVCREVAAAYISVSPGTFDKLVAAGSMPRPKRVSAGRLAWDVRQLDAAVDRLPSEAEDASPSDGWEDVDAA